MYILWNERGRFSKVLEGKPAPEFTLPALGGGRISLDDYKGSVVLVNLWVSWCAPCREEMPSLERLYRHFRGKDFEILAVSTDKDEEVVEGLALELELTFPILLDPREKVARMYRITGFPESFLIDQEGIVRKRFVGPWGWDSPSNISLIENLLNDGQDG